MCKIVILSTVHHYKDARIFKEISSLKKKYSDIYFIVPIDKQQEKFTENGISIIPLPFPKTRKQRLLIQKEAYKIIKTLQPDILHFHDPELMLLAYWIKRKQNLKVIFDIHENVAGAIKDSDWLPNFLRPIVSNLYKRIEKKIISKFDAIIIAETSYRKIYGEKAIELLNFPKLPKTENKIIHKSFKQPITFVYSGMIWERRGIFKMLALIKTLYDNNYKIRFNLIGPFASKKLENQVKVFILENGLSEIITIYGRKPFYEMLEILSKSHIGLALLENIENYRESLSSKIFDYMSMGLPYLVSNFKIYDNFTVKAKTGITVNYSDDKEIYSKAVELISNDDLMKEMSINGQRKVKTQWNWETQEKKLLNLYTQLGC